MGDEWLTPREYNQLLQEEKDEKSHIKPLLDLNISNTIPVDGRHHLVESITSWGPNPPLKYLQLKNCKVPPEVSCDLFMCLAACIDLADLDLIGNTIGEEGYYLAESIRSWGQNTSLKKLLLCNCKIPGDVCADLVKYLTFCRHLNHLYLPGNNLASARTHLTEVFRSWTPRLSVATRKQVENICLRKHSKPPGDQDIRLAESKRLSYSQLNPRILVCRVYI